jgi:hypothetical protein
MGIILQNNAEMGTDGTNVTTSNSGDANNDAWVFIMGEGGLVPKFSSAQAGSGTLSYNMKPGGGYFPELHWDIIPNKTTLYMSMRFYYLTAVFDANIINFSYLGGIAGAVSITSGKVELLDDTATVVATSSSSIPVNTWVRIEFKITAAASGFLQARIYLNHNAITPTEVIQATASTKTNIDHVQFTGDFFSALTLYFDDFIIRDDAYPDPPYNKMTTAWLRF